MRTGRPSSAPGCGPPWPPPDSYRGPPRELHQPRLLRLPAGRPGRLPRAAHAVGQVPPAAGGELAVLPVVEPVVLLGPGRPDRRGLRRRPVDRGGADAAAAEVVAHREPRR